MRPQRPATRRLGVTPGRRAGLMLVVALGLLVGPGSIATADQTTPLVAATVYHSGSSSTPDTVSLADLKAAGCPQYSQSSMRELSPQGWTDVDLPPSTEDTGTWSMSTILECMQTPIPPRDVTGVTVIDSNGIPEASSGSPLSPSDLASPSDFQNSSENPVVSDQGTEIEYDRPWRGGTDEDFKDEVGEAPPLSIEVYEGPPLTITPKASQTTVAPGTAVSFSASASGQDATGLAYSWNFDGAATNSTQPTPTVTFATPGTWNVTVTVSDAAGGGGAAQLPITVTGAQPKSGSGSRSGPDSSAGKTPRGSAGHREPSSSSHSTRGGTKSANSTSVNQGSAGASAPTSAGSATTPSGTSQGTPASPSPHAPRAGRHANQPAARPHPGPPASPAAISNAPVVRGRLISDVLPLSASASPLVHEQPAVAATAPAIRRAAPVSALTIVAAGLAIALLLVLGAWRELRGTRGRRAPDF